MAFVQALTICALVATINGASIKSTYLPKVSTNGGKIVGGYQIDIADIPYQVTLQRNGRHHCGGSIISDRWILTAAHCTEGLANPSAYTVRAGSTARSEGGQLVKVKTIHSHPGYDSSVTENDFCLLELETSLELSRTVKTIALAREEPADGSASLVSGWGATQSADESSELLRAVVVPVVNRSECAKAYGKMNLDITNAMICAGFLEEGAKDSCQGDSGGPMVIDEELVGVVSWGKGCAVAGYPGVYANVAAVRGWIKEVANV